MTEKAAPKFTGTFAGQFLIRAILIAGVAACLALFAASPALAQRGSHVGGFHGASSHGSSRGGAHANGSHGGAHFAGARISAGTRVEGPVTRMSAGGAARLDSAAAAFSSPAASSERDTRIVFVSGAGRVSAATLENAAIGDRTLAAGNRLWVPPSAFAENPQQQGHPVMPPPVRPAPMPVAPPIMARPISMPPAPMMRPPVSPIHVAPMPGAPRPVFMPARPLPAPPEARPVVVPPSVRPRVAPVAPMPRFRVGAPVRPRIAFGMTSLPAPAKFSHVTLMPGFGRSRGAFAMSTPVPPLFFCGPGTLCSFDFDGDGDFDNFVFFPQSFFFFGFGGPFGFGSPCAFQGPFLNCFGATSWNGPFGLGWQTPWGHNPGSGSLYPIGGYISPTPAEQNEASVNSIGPTTFLPPQPEQLALMPEEAPSASAIQPPVAYLVTKDGIEFGVTSYWLQDNRVFYVTMYNIASSIALDQLDLQTTVDLNYKRGISFTLTPKPVDQKPPDSQPQPSQAPPQ